MAQVIKKHEYVVVKVYLKSGIKRAFTVPGNLTCYEFLTTYFPPAFTFIPRLVNKSVKYEEAEFGQRRLISMPYTKQNDLGQHVFALSDFEIGYTKNIRVCAKLNPNDDDDS